jgi:hypothetical protein
LKSEAKPLPAAKADLGPLFDVQHEKKSSMHRSGYICGFSPHRKSNINPTSTFSLRVGFASLPLVFALPAPWYSEQPAPTLNRLTAPNPPPHRTRTSSMIRSILLTLATQSRWLLLKKIPKRAQSN